MNSGLVILSGGQTGVDRAALDAALELKTACGGWCPQGRKAEDGPLPERYPLRELPGGGYLQRTRKNVEDSDATLVNDAATTSMNASADQAVEFVKKRAVQRLNVAGPRASGEPRGYAYARELIRRLVTQVGSGD